MSTPIPDDFPLTPQSIVFDVGAYHGLWSRQIASRYNCRIYAFEPVRSAYNKLCCGAPGDIRPMPFGLAPSSGKATMYLHGDGSTLIQPGELRDTEVVDLVEPAEFMAGQGMARVDLLKLNIEGAEYALLEHIIATGLLDRIGDLLVQFHPWPEGHTERTWAIIKALEPTHALSGDLTWAVFNRRKS